MGVVQRSKKGGKQGRPRVKAKATVWKQPSECSAGVDFADNLSSLARYVTITSNVSTNVSKQTRRKKDAGMEGRLMNDKSEMIDAGALGNVHILNYRHFLSGLFTHASTHARTTDLRAQGEHIHRRVRTHKSCTHTRSTHTHTHTHILELHAHTQQLPLAPAVTQFFISLGRSSSTCARDEPNGRVQDNDLGYIFIVLNLRIRSLPSLPRRSILFAQIIR